MEITSNIQAVLVFFILPVALSALLWHPICLMLAVDEPTFESQDK